MAKKGKKPKTGPSNAAVFEEGDLVGAKVKGHPLWPSRVEKVEILNGRRVYTVRFFQTDQTGKSFAELKHFKDFTPQERRCNRKGFQEALDLCQKEFDFQNSGSKSDGNEKPEPAASEDESPCSSPIQNSLSIVEETAAVIEPKLELAATKRPLKRIGSDTPTHKKIKIEKASKPIKKEAEEHDSAAESEILNGTNQEDSDAPILKQPKHQKREKGENAIKTIPQRERAIAKLREKKAAYDAEKKRRKEEFKKERALQKATETYPKVIDNLMRFSKILQSLSKVNSASQLKLEIWDSAVCVFTNNTLSILAKCIRSDHHNQSTERRRCHDALVGVVEALNAALENDELPSTLRDGVLKSKKQIKKTKEVSNFINTENGGQKKAMIERRENDA